MHKVLIIVNAKVKEAGRIISASPVTQKMVSALSEAIEKEILCHQNSSIPGEVSGIDISKPVKIEVISAGTLWSDSKKLKTNNHTSIYCPLTIQLPDHFDFPARRIYKACQDIKGRRRWVEKKLGYKSCVNDFQLGDLWLPIILTAHGPLYGEVIGEGEIPNSYQQPADFPDSQRQSLYNLAHNLLENLKALPAVYLLQFSWRAQEIVFDRLWPFPAAPALASIRVQQPDLYTCHWHCLTGQQISDLTIIGKKTVAGI
ncbi:MAG: hypothetical protein AB4038_01775 [Prochloraceae cyanobacterium]